MYLVSVWIELRVSSERAMTKAETARGESKMLGILPRLPRRADCLTCSARVASQEYKETHKEIIFKKMTD